MNDTTAERNVLENHGDITIEMIEVGKTTLRVATKPGDPGRVPLLMFNGIGANLELAFPFLQAMRGTPAILFDIPGVGGSPMPRLPYSPITMARTTRRLLDVLGHDQVDVSGVSWGGGLAQQFACQYRSRCRRLVLVATAAGWTMVPGKLGVLSKMGNIRRYTDRGYMREIAAEIYGGDFRTDPTLINQHAAAMRPSSNAGYFLQLLAMVGWTSAPFLWTLPQPTLIMSGTDDPLVPVANARFLKRLIPHAELQLVENGHLFAVTRPEETAQSVTDFLTKEI
ncbi:MAG: poly(3-hydroxyalkanoate) depolymerase [Pseudomonadota bacterium]